ncbi:uncharacterized protein KQ657_004179 [Scheffersomyces spartinae]|uniref:dolichol kinase n=1 Tax=Scheffersomyces spartinae TaxID=45513 RepID=A0A9P7VC40_9ASCO|nr:uncharacterized protein KQ657_004179 [Scheffersomyces spartinae]KAG7195065.1 hypothetical protein KQ657_004179 [Scheffersomyces spartinae]
MAPKGNKKKSAGAGSGNSISTAQIFQEGSKELEELTRKENEKIEALQQLKKQKESTNPATDRDDDPSEYNFPMNVIFYVQDFVNDNMTFIKFVQLMVQAYVVEILWFQREKYDDLVRTLPFIGFNYLGVFLGLFGIYYSQAKQHKKRPDVVAPPVAPSFDLIYAVLFPVYLSIILGIDEFLVVNMALNYFILDKNLHAGFKGLSAITYYWMYASDFSETSVPIFQMVQYVVAFYFIKTVIEYVNERNGKRTLADGEIQLVSLALFNIFGNLLIINTPILPIQIFSKLLVALTFASVFSFPFYYAYNRYNRSLLWAICTSIVFSGVFYYVTDFALNPILDQQPIDWLLAYVQETPQRIYLIKVWASILLVSIPAMLSPLSSVLPLNIKRKTWHFVLFFSILFATGFDATSITNDPEFHLLALLGSSCVLIGVEIIRASEFTGLGNIINSLMLPFQDAKDLQGPLNLSYIFLLLGVAIPFGITYWKTGTVEPSSFIGFISLGICDSVASIVGQLCGTVKWKGSDKSIQGTLAFTSTGLLVFKLLDDFYFINKVTNWENVLITFLVGGVFEGVCELNDNLLLPIFMSIVLHLMNIGF